VRTPAVDLDALCGLPRRGWVDAPSPVTPAPQLAQSLGLGWAGFKRDDLIPRLYGGSKIRKLDYLLATPPFADAPSWASWGAIGSGHLVALCAAAAELDRRLEAHMFWQPTSEHVLDNLAFVASGPTKIVYFGSRPALALGAPRLLVGRARGRRLVPAGATHPAGIVGLVRAGLELAGQVAEGVLPAPDHLFLPLGTGGTAAGLLLGLGLAGLRPVVHAVAVAEPLFCSEARVRSLVERTRVWLAGQGLGSSEVELPELRVSHAHVGPGYGAPSEASTEACARLADLDLPLEGIYSGKAMAALLAEPPPGANVLFWLTPRSAGSLPHAQQWLERLPYELRRRLPPTNARWLSRRAFLCRAVAVTALAGWVRTSGYAPRPEWSGQRLSPWQAEVLEAVAEALLPPAPDEGCWETIPARVDGFLTTLPAPMLLEIDGLFAALEHGTTALGHSFSRLSALEPESREAYLRGLADAGGLRRQLYQGVRDLCFLGYYQQPQTWAALGYEGPRVGPETRPDRYQRFVAPRGDLPVGYRQAS
jgi:D-cysteine desulfhydrase